MVKEPEEPLLLEDESEEGGGPVKPFLEHLEDLRWTLIKCVSALVISMVICLIASKYIVSFLERPLHDAARLVLGTNQLVKVSVGNNSFSFSPPATNEAWRALIGTNQFSKLRMEPVLRGTDWVPTFTPAAFEANEVPSLVVLKNYGPFTGFSIMIKVAIYGGFGLATPFLFLFIAQFVVPALRGREKDFLVKGAWFGGVLFFAGVIFCYKIIMPVTLLAAVQVSEYLSFEANEWRAEEYISFIFKFMIAMGVAFQLPVLLLTLVKIGILDYKKLAKWRMYWVVINLILCAVVTPSADPLTMLMMAGPLHLLYELSILIAWIWYRRDQKAEAKAKAKA